MPIPERRVKINIRLPEYVYSAMRWHSLSQDRSMSDVARQAIQNYTGRVKDYKPEKKKRQFRLKLSLSESAIFRTQMEKHPVSKAQLFICAIIEYTEANGGLMKATEERAVSKRSGVFIPASQTKGKAK